MCDYDSFSAFVQSIWRRQSFSLMWGELIRVCLFLYMHDIIYFVGIFPFIWCENNFKVLTIKVDLTIIWG